jgi:hypothetical protein
MNVAFARGINLLVSGCREQEEQGRGYHSFQYVEHVRENPQRRMGEIGLWKTST